MKKFVLVEENSDPSALGRYVVYFDDGTVRAVTECFQYITYGARSEPRLTPLARYEVNMLRYLMKREERMNRLDGTSKVVESRLLPADLV